MKNQYMPKYKRDCPHCQGIDSLEYYHEEGTDDLYWCNKCYGKARWNGRNKLKAEGIAYPNRTINKIKQ
jgi:hypothetical protein